LEFTLSNKITNPDQINIGLVQINNSFSGQNYLPYSVAMLQSYLESKAAQPEKFNFFLPVYRRMPVATIVDQLKTADVVGFSTYVWNARISLEIARRLKALNPDVLVIFGGPHVPDEPEEFLRENRCIDIAVHNEGEAIFLSIMEAFPERPWQDIPSVSFVAPDGAFVRTANGPRFRDLEEVPSPFLNGTFDALVEANPDERWIGLWETNRGCPFQCTFCDWGSATAAKVTKFGLDRLMEEVHWFADKKVEYIFCCDANFGIQKRDVDIAEYVAKIKNQTGYPHALSVQNTKNATERAYLTQKILSDAGLNKGVALSMQSVDMGTLKAIKRENIALDTYTELQRRFTRDKVETYSDLILGLPGETYETFVDGVNLLIETGQHNRIQFNNLSILPNAEMGSAAYQKEYGIVTIPCEIINIHGERVILEDDVSEIQDLVIETNSMPREDWRRTRSFCWMTALLHFDKLFQIPLMMANTISGLSYRHMIEAFMNADAAEYPVVAGIGEFFLKEAEAIQGGGAEYVFSEDWLGIYWPADEYVFIELTEQKNFSAFYAEATKLLTSLVESEVTADQMVALGEAVEVNHALVRQPFVTDDVVIKTEFDIIGFHDSMRNGEEFQLGKAPTVITIERSKHAEHDFQTWCREVVWWGNKKGAYLYTNQVEGRQLAGHY
jgi:radical SAM superfamily enzyme YgiQ (UPF0313 family)